MIEMGNGWTVSLKDDSCLQKLSYGKRLGGITLKRLLQHNSLAKKGQMRQKHFSKKELSFNG